MSDWAVAVPGALGALCLLMVCAVYWRRHGLRPGSVLLVLCGVALLGWSSWRPWAEDRAPPDLALRLDAIDAALMRLDEQVARIAEQQGEMAEQQGEMAEQQGEIAERQGEIAQRQGELAAALAAPAEKPAAPSPPEDAAASEPATETGAPTLEIEVLGGVSDEEMAAIIAWIEQVRAERPTSALFVEPVMPLDSTDPNGQRKRLMDEAGRVIDHVFAALRQRLDIVSIASEPVPGPRLRLGFSGA